MADFYGVKTEELKTSVGTPVVAESGIAIAFGTAPIHQVDGTANEIIMASSYEEAVSALGYSDDWEKYSLCEVMYSHFKLYGMAPILLVNVLDPATKKAAVEGASFQITDGKVELSGDAIASSVVVTNEGETYVAGTDYETFYEDGKLILEVLPDGAIGSKATVTIAYDKVTFTKEQMKAEIIGGYDVETGKSKGMELMDMAFFKTRVLPDIIIAPGYSDDPEVAAVMATKTTFSGVFKAVCICDLPKEATSYQKAVEIKEANNSYRCERQIVCWSHVGLAGKTYHLSTQLAGLMCKLDNENSNIPSRVASNQALQADSAVLADGTEVLLDLTQANFVRSNGIVTAYNFVNGFTAWGVNTGCATRSGDVKDKIISITRMFGYVANAIVLSLWSRVDENLTPRFAESIIDDLNMWLNGLVASENLLGARCEIKESENPMQDLMNGIVRVHVYMTPPSPAQQIDAMLEYDVDYVSSVIGGIE